MMLDLGKTSVRNEINHIADVLQLDHSKSIDAQIVRWFGEHWQGGSIAA